MKHILFAVVLLVFCGIVQAQQNFPRDIAISWTNASEYEDVIINGVPESGGPIEAGDLEFVRIEIYRQSDVVPVLTATIPDTGEGAAQTEIFVGAIPRPGTYRIEGYSIVIDGVESDASVPMFKKYTGKPRTITSVIIQ
jgi:hypothetical protein